jgi:hypothetical protein
MGGLSVAFAGLKCSVAVRSSAVKMSEEEEGEDVYLENEKPVCDNLINRIFFNFFFFFFEKNIFQCSFYDQAEEDNDFDIAFSKRKNPKVIYVGEFTHEYIDGNLPADFDDEDDNISSAYFISSTRLLYTETSSSDAVTLVDPSLYPSLSRASVCYNERILLITSTTSLLFSLLLDFHKRCKMIKRAPLPVSHSPQSSFSQASKESMSKKGSISSPLSRLSMGGGYSVGESKPKQEQTETRKLGAAEEDDYLVEMVVSYDENSIILCLEQGLFTTLIYLLSKIEIFLTSVDSSISNIALNTPWITPFVSSSLFLITSLKVSLNASSPPCTSAFSFSFAPSTSLSFWTSPTPSSFLSHLLSFLFSFLYYKFIPALISSIYSVLYDKKDPNILDPFSMEGFQMFEYSEASKSEKSPYVVLNYLLALHSVVHLVSGNNSINYTQITSSFPLYLSPSLLGDISSSLYSYSGCYDTTIQTSVEQEDVSTIVLSKELNCDDNFISNPPPIGLFLITTALVNSNVLTVLLHLLLLYGLPTSLTSAVAQNDYTKSFTEEQEDKKSITISLTFAFIITHIFSFFSVTPDLAYAISQHPLSVSTLLDVLYSYYRYWKRYSVECENKNESDEGEIDRLSSLPSSPPILTPLMLHLTKKVLVDIVLKNYDDEINLKHLVKNITIIHTINVMRQSIVEIAILKKIVKEGLEEERKKKEKAFLYSEIYDISLLHSLLQLTLCLFLPVPPPPGGFEIKTQDPNSSKTSIDCASTRSSVASHLSISSRGTTNLARNALSAAKSHQTLPYLLQSVIIATLITNGIVETVLPVYAGLPLAVTRVGAEEEDRVVEDVTAKDEDVVDGTQININLVSATSLSTYSTEKKKIENVAKTVLLQLGIKGSPFYFQIFNAIIPPSSEKVEQEKIDSISNIFSSSSFLSYFSLHLLVPYAFNIFILLLSSSTVVSNMNRLGFIKMNGPLLSLSTLSSYSSITASAPLLEMCNILFKRIDGLKGEQSIANVVFTDVEATITTEDNVSVPIKYQCTPILRKRYVYFDLFDDYLDLYKQKLLAYKNYLKKQVLDKIDISSEQSGKPPGKRGRINLSEQTPVSSEERSAKVVKKEKEIYDKITMLNSILFSTSVSLETSLTSATQPSSDMSLYLLSFESLRLITYVFSLLQSSTTTTANQVSSNSISLESGTALPALLTYARNIMVSCGVNPDLFSPTSTDDTFIQSRNIILSSSLSSSPLLSLASSLAYFSISRIILSVSASTTQNAFFLLNMDINNATVSLLSSSLYYYLALLPRIGGSFYTFDEEGGNFTTVSVTDCNFNFYFTSSLSTVYFNILTSIIETLSFLCLAPPPSSSSNIPTSSFPLNSFLSSSILSLLLVLPPPLLTKYVLPSAVKDMVNEDGDLEILKDDQIESTINPHKFRTHKRVLSVSTNPFQSGASISTLNSIIPTNLTTKETKAKGLTTAPGAFLRPYYILPSSPAPSTDPLLLSSPFSSLSLLQLSHRLFCFIVRLTTSTSSSASASLLQIVIQKIKEKIDISLNSSSTSQDSPSFSSLPHLSLLLFIHFLLPTLTPPPSTTPGVSTTGSVISYRSTATRQSTSEASALSITTASVSQRRRTNRENRARMRLDLLFFLCTFLFNFLFFFRSLFFSAFPVFASCLHLVVGLLRTVKELSTKQYTGSSAKSKRPSFLYTYLKILLEIIGNIVRNSREMQLTTASTSAVSEFIQFFIFIFENTIVMLMRKRNVKGKRRNSRLQVSQ